MKADRRWWNDGRLERELNARQQGYDGVEYVGGVALGVVKRDAPTLFGAARAVRPYDPWSRREGTWPAAWCP